MENDSGGEARGRLLDAAEKLFSRKGYTAVTLREIGAELGLSHASLYYHFPGGKEALFAEVTERNLRSHGRGLDAALAAGKGNLREMLYRAAEWLLSQSPMDLIRMAESDMPALPPAIAHRLMELAYALIIARLRDILVGAIAEGTIGADTDAGLIAGGFFGLVESLHAIPDFATKKNRLTMAKELIDVLLRGLGYKDGGTKK